MLSPSVYFVLIFDSTFNPTRNYARLDVLEDVINDLYHTFIMQDDEDVPIIEAIEAFFRLPETLEVIKQDLYFE